MHQLNQSFFFVFLIMSFISASTFAVILFHIMPKKEGKKDSRNIAQKLPTFSKYHRNSLLVKLEVLTHMFF